MTDIAHGSAFGATGTRLDLVHHVGVAVHDADLALPYYTEQLGLELVGDEVATDPGVRLVYLGASNTLIQLVQPVRDGPIAEFLRTRGEGLHHVCFQVERIDEVLAALDGEEQARIFLGGQSRRACFLLKQPNGVRIELTERDPVS